MTPFDADRLCCNCGELWDSCACNDGPMGEDALAEALMALLAEGLEPVAALARLGLRPYGKE